MPVSTFYYSDNPPTTSNSSYITRYDYLYDKNLISGDIGDGVAGIPVVGVYGAFAEQTGLKSITLPDTISTIPNRSFFNCYSLNNIKFPSYLTIIGNAAFAQCYSLTGTLTLPNTVYSLSTSAFTNCTGLTDFIFSNSLISIGTLTLQNCTSIKSVTIPSSVTSIADNAFLTCTSLTNIIVSPLNNYYSNDQFGVLFNKNKTSVLRYPYGRSGSYDIPNGVTTINPVAFHLSSNLTNVTIPNSVTTIGESAFNSCSTLTSVIIPNTVTGVLDFVFFNCSNLNNVTLSNNITSIGNNMFYGCSSLNSINIPAKVTFIDEQAFLDCINLTRINFLGSPPTLGVDVFTNTNPNLKIYRYSTKFGWSGAFDGKDVLLIDSPIHKGLQTFGFVNISLGKGSINKQNVGNGKITLRKN